LGLCNTKGNNKGQKSLSPTKQRHSRKKVFGFDIETWDKNREFLCASIWSRGYKRVMYSKQEVIDELHHSRYKNSYIAATNLSFDFFGTFYKTPVLSHFDVLFRGSDLIYAKTYVQPDGSWKSSAGKSGKSIMFIDTMNYAQLGVAKIGAIIGINKIKSPMYLGKYPILLEEFKAMVYYNLRDSEISARFLEFLVVSFEKMGATFKSTIASTAMSLFRNKYLKDEYFRHDIPVLKDLFKAYYGGRTETFKRGKVSDLNYYDINSLYPSVMHDCLYPDPNTMRITHKNSRKYIDMYDGVSSVEIHCPDSIKVPLLPYRYDNKLYFPRGTFKGWYSHVELRKAMDLGYILKHVEKTYYYKESCCPFVDYVSDIYAKRMKYKSEGSVMQLIAKLFLNSLYGKFGQKFEDRDLWIHEDDFDPEKHQGTCRIDRIGEYFRVSADSDPACFCIPIWALYVTAHARLKLYEYLSSCDPYYCDTDSIITKTALPTSKLLGDMKLEMSISSGFIIKPKMYAVIDADDNTYVKIKGVRQMLFKDFVKMMEFPKVSYDKFSKFKESMRRGFIPNEIRPVTKNLSLDDSKRDWDNIHFDPTVMQSSDPMQLIDGIPEMIYNEKLQRAIDMHLRATQRVQNKFIQSDLFDSASVGSDISDDEFIKNEMTDVWRHET